MLRASGHRRRRGGPLNLHALLFMGSHPAARRASIQLTIHQQLLFADAVEEVVKEAVVRSPTLCPRRRPERHTGLYFSLRNDRITARACSGCSSMIQ